MAQVIGMNPMQTTNARGSFHLQSAGWYQGVALDDPAARYALCSGYLDRAEANVLWGGLPVQELVPGNQQAPYGARIKRSLALATLTGFSVFNQAHNAITTPQSPVPIFLQGMSVSFYRLGSGARIPVKASAALIAAFAAGLQVTSPVIWNYAAGALDLFSTIAGDAVATTALTYDGATGLATATTGAAHNLQPGAIVTIADAVPAQYNGTVQVVAVPTGTTFTYAPVAAPTATPATTQGEISAAASADFALPVRVIEVKEGNCKTVEYSNTDGVATWNENDSCALILL